MTTKKTPDVAEVAQALGMKEREVVDVQPGADGTLARTHDGNWTLIRDGGVLEFIGQDLGERAIVGESGPENVEVQPGAKVQPAPKGRG